MAGIVKKLNIGEVEITFVIRYRWEKNEDKTRKLMNDITMWRNWELGLWFKRIQIVGKKNFHKPSEWGNNLVNQYMFGINLLIWKLWITFVRKGMNIKIDENEKLRNT